MLQKTVFISVPQCGTHLLLRYFDRAGFRHIGPYNSLVYKASMCDTVKKLEFGDYTAWHYPWSEQIVSHIKEVGAKAVLLFRDPRAQICSRMHFILRLETHPLHNLFAKYLRTNHERMVRLIKGIPAEELQAFTRPIGDWDSLNVEDGKGPLSILRRGVNDNYRYFARWLDEPFVHTVRFEDIIGPQGGGCREKQLSVLRELMDFTGVKVGSPDAETLAGLLFNRDTATFRKGQIDSWKEDFTPELHDIFLEESANLLQLWGYAPKEDRLG